MVFRKAGIDFYKAFKFCPRAELSSYWPSANLVLYYRWTVFTLNCTLKEHFWQAYVLLSKTGNTVWPSCRNWDYSRFLIHCIAWTWLFYYCDIKDVISHFSFKAGRFSPQSKCCVTCACVSVLGTDQKTKGRLSQFYQAADLLSSRLHVKQLPSKGCLMILGWHT